MNKTKIEWCDYTVNPVKGYCPVGCPYCYARAMYDRFGWDKTIRQDTNEYLRVLNLKKPSRIFVGSTIDLAALAVLDEKTIWQAIANTGVKHVDWIACKEYDQNQTYVHIYIELKEKGHIDNLADMIDEQLRVVDVDYQDIGDYLNQKAVKVTVLSTGTFQRYTDEKIKTGADLAMLKPAHMNAPPEVVQQLL